MRLTARISIDIDARDIADAAGHERTVQAMFEIVKGRYRRASLEFRQRGAGPTSAKKQLQHYTGRMCEYEE